jgi:protein-disulfide isomerase
MFKKVLLAAAILSFVADARQKPEIPNIEAIDFKVYDGKFFEITDGDIYFGNKNAPVKVVEFSSYSCVHCATFYKSFQRLYGDYISKGKVVLIHREHPLDKQSLYATHFVRCIKSLDSKKAAVLELYQTQMQWVLDASGKKVDEVLRKFDVDQKCLNDKTLDDKILKEALEHQNDLKIVSTPTVFVQGRKLTKWHQGDFFSAIDDALKSKK